MAQVGVQQPTNLMEMFSSPSLMLGDIAAQQVNDQTIGNLLNRQQAQQAMGFAAQEQPFKLDQMGLTNQTTRAQLPGVQADSSLKQDKAAISRNTRGQQERATISKLAKEVSDDDYAVFENGVHQMRASSDPEIRKHGNTLFPYLKSIAAERDKLNIQGANQLANTNASIAGQKQIEQMRIDAGKYKDKNASTDFWVSFNKLKNAKDKHAALVLAARQELQQGNEEGANKFRELAEEIRPQAEAEINAGAKPDQLDLAAMAGGKLPTKTNPGIAPGNPTTTPQSASFSSEQDAEAALASGKIKVGDIVIINGRRARVK